MIANVGANVVHNPSSNMNNAVGVSRVQQFLKSGIKLCLGTDGMNSDMVMEEKTCYVIYKLNTKDP